MMPGIPGGLQYDRSRLVTPLLARDSATIASCFFAYSPLSLGPGSGAAPEPGPKLKGEYAKKHDAMVAESRANNGVTKRERSYCSPPGMPGIMRLAQYPYE